MRLFRLGRMINRLLVLGILVGIVLIIFMWKADDDFVNTIREKIGVPIVEIVDDVANDIVNVEQEEE